MAEKSVIWRDQAVFLNSTQYIGRINKATCELRKKMTTLSGIGGVGDVEAPTGKYDPITAQVEFNSLSTADVRQLAAKDGYVELRMTGTVRVLDTDSGTRTVGAAVTRIKGWIKNPPVPGQSETQESYTAEISVLFLEVSDQQGTALLIDVPNGIVSPSGDSGDLGISITV